MNKESIFSMNKDFQKTIANLHGNGFIQEEVLVKIEEMRYCKMVSLSQQGTWTKWEGIERKRLK